MMVKIGLARVALTVAVALVCAAGLGVARVNDDDLITVGSYEVFAEIPVGTGEGAIGVNLNVVGGNPLGPDALASDADGDLYVLDTLQNQIIVLNGREVSETVHIDFALYPCDLVCTDGGFYILNCDGVIFKASADGELIASYALPENMGSLMVLSMREVENGLELYTIKNDIYTLYLNKKFPEDPFEKLSVEFTKAQREPIPFLAGREVAVENGGFVFTTTTDIAVVDSHITVEPIIEKYNADGHRLGIARLPIELSETYVNSPVEITKGNEIYYLAPSGENVKIVKVSLGDIYESHLPRP